MKSRNECKSPLLIRLLNLRSSFVNAIGSPLNVVNFDSLYTLYRDISTVSKYMRILASISKSKIDRAVVNLLLENSNLPLSFCFSRCFFIKASISPSGFVPISFALRENTIRLSKPSVIFLRNSLFTWHRDIHLYNKLSY